MARSFFKTFFGVLITLGAAFAVLAAFLYFTEQKADYIEIYNNDDEGSLF